MCLTVINNGIINIIQHNQEKEKEFILERQSGMIS